MHLIEHGLGIGKYPRVEGEGAVPGVPPGGSEAGAEIDHRVAGKPFLAEGTHLFEDRVPAEESTVRLLIAESPERRQVRETAQLCKLPEQSCGLGFGSENKEDILRLGGGRGTKDAARAGEVEGALRMVKVEAPSRRADKPGNRRSVSIQELLRVELAVAHVVDDTAAVELVSAFAEAEYRTVIEIKGNASRIAIEGETLAFFARLFDGKDERVAGDMDSESAPAERRLRGRL